MTIYNHIFEKSTVLDNCSYDSEKQELSITFQNGKTYRYKEVSINTFNDLIGAKSAGQYFSSIKAGLAQT